MHVVVTGAQGQLGAVVVDTFADGHRVTPLARADLDVTGDDAVADVMERLRPDVLINCAGFNDVDGAEDQPVAVLDVNAFAVRALARAAAHAGAVFVQYSSDFVFDGRTDRPYAETDRPNPQSVYAASKLLGEWFAADAPRHYILRVESLFGSPLPRRSSAAAIFDRLRRGEDVPVFVDRVVSPTYVVDAASATRAIVERALPAGLYHCVNSGRCTWLEFATEAAGLLGCQPRLKPIVFAEARLRARRPAFSALSNDALRAHGIAIPDWRDALKRCLQPAPVFEQ